MSKTPLNRRGFLDRCTHLFGLALMAPLANLLPSNAMAQRRRGGGSAEGASELSWPLVEPGKGTAAAVNYVEEKKKITAATLKTDRQGMKFDAQDCANCGFYKSVGKKNGKEVGTCQIFPKQLVVGAGWCASWNKKS